MSDYLEELSSSQIDVFREIGNIGAGNAATALAGLLNKRIDMSIPDVQIVPFNDIVNILDGPESLVVGVLIDMEGDLSGYILMILGIEDAYEMLSIALNEERKLPADFNAQEHLNDMDRSVLSEIANILVGAYLSAIGALTNLSVMPAVPELAIDMVGAIMSIVAIEYGQIGDSVLFFKTQFSDIEKNLAGHFFLIPDYESYKILMGSLGML